MKNKTSEMVENIAADLNPLIKSIDLFVPDPKNLRTHDNRNIAAIANSLSMFGMRKPIVAQRMASGKFKVRAGNGTLQAALGLGWKRIASVIIEEGDDQAIAFAIADNRTAELAEWDSEALGATLVDLLKIDTGGFSYESLGFDAAEFEAVAGVAASGNAGEIDPDLVPEPPDAATTRRGDVWILGNHRLMCGDSSLAPDVDKLLGGAQIHLVNMDPPYNVKVEPRSNNAIAAGLSSFGSSDAIKAADARGMHHQGFDLGRDASKSKRTTRKLRAKDRPLNNDFLSDEEFDRLLRAWFGNASRVLAPGRGFYIWGGYANCANYPSALKTSGLYFSQAVIWVKEHPVLTRKDFMGNHEWCFYGWKEGAGHYFNPEIKNASDVWFVKKLNHTQMVHLTEKPTELAELAMKYSSVPGENVLDLFGGSGSTLIGAEKAGRNAFLMEMDDLYCDVIVKRFEMFTGKKAMLLGAPDGVVGFDAVASMRKESNPPVSDGQSA